MMTRTASAEVGRQTDATRASLSAWLRMQTEFGKTIPNLRVSDGSLERVIANLPSYTPSQKQSQPLRRDRGFSMANIGPRRNLMAYLRKRSMVGRSYSPYGIELQGRKATDVIVIIDIST